MVAQLVTPPQLLSRDLWDPEGWAWKSLQALQMTYHATNRNKKQIIVASIPWSPQITLIAFKQGIGSTKEYSEITPL
jgi:hypothetical protein